MRTSTLAKVGSNSLDVVAELLAVLEVELVLTTLLDRHREGTPKLVGSTGDVGAELLVGEHAEPVAVAGGLVGVEESGPDDLFGAT